MYKNKAPRKVINQSSERNSPLNNLNHSPTLQFITKRLESEEHNKLKHVTSHSPRAAQLKVSQKIISQSLPANPVIQKMEAALLGEEDNAVENIPTTRAGFGRVQRGGLLGCFGMTRERSDQEIAAQVRNITDNNHQILYEALRGSDNEDTVNLARLVQGTRDDGARSPGALCHDLTRHLVEQRTETRPTIPELRENGEASMRHAYDLNGAGSLNDTLVAATPGTSVFLGEEDAMSGHTFTVVGHHQGRVVVADRHPANPVGALKYADAVEAEARLSRSLRPDAHAAIDREFSGGVTLNHFQ